MKFKNIFALFRKPVAPPLPCKTAVLQPKPLVAGQVVEEPSIPKTEEDLWGSLHAGPVRVYDLVNKRHFPRQFIQAFAEKYKDRVVIESPGTTGCKGRPPLVISLRSPALVATPVEPAALPKVMSYLGSKTSEAKSAAARANGLKGGRPRADGKRPGSSRAAESAQAAVIKAVHELPEDKEIVRFAEADHSSVQVWQAIKSSHLWTRPWGEIPEWRGEAWSLLDHLLANPATRETIAPHALHGSITAHLRHLKRLFPEIFSRAALFKGSRRSRLSRNLWVIRNPAVTVEAATASTPEIRPEEAWSLEREARSR